MSKYEALALAFIIGALSAPLIAMIVFNSDGEDCRPPRIKKHIQLVQKCCVWQDTGRGTYIHICYT